ncbi:MAG: protein kinase [Anaerolineaceae bacterium]|nr:protein kinase [Anaerolineaceae bacterium]
MSNDTLLNNRYRLVAQQGSGGMAVIYKAVDVELGRTVAVKVLRPSLTSDPSFLTRFRNEARSVANLSHPNIVTVYDVGADGPTHYIVMEFVEGQDLKKIIKSEGILSVDRTLKLAIQICAGIGFAHRAGLVHADVKPQNILVTKGDIIKVTDFGIAQALSDTQPGEKQSVVWGSPHYFAPEQARGERPTPASDVYAIGIVLFEMLTGRLPYVGASQQELAMAHIKEQIPRVSDFNPNVPENLTQIIQKVMSKEPSARYRMADQLGHVLESYRARGREQTISNPSISSSMPLPQKPTVPPAQSQPQTPPPPPTNLPFSQVQPPYQPTAPRPSFPPAEPTQRYSAVPEAPNSPQSARPSHLPSPFEAPGQTPPPRQAAVPQDWETTGRQYYSQALDRHEDISPGLDIITIMLAALAFLAVACLIPLYIAVLQARLG